MLLYHKNRKTLLSHTHIYIHIDERQFSFPISLILQGRAPAFMQIHYSMNAFLQVQKQALLITTYANTPMNVNVIEDN